MAVSPLDIVNLPVVVEGPHESSPGGESTAERLTLSAPNTLDEPLPFTLMHSVPVGWVVGQSTTSMLTENKTDRVCETGVLVGEGAVVAVGCSDVGVATPTDVFVAWATGGGVVEVSQATKVTSRTAQSAVTPTTSDKRRIVAALR